MKFKQLSTLLLLAGTSFLSFATQVNSLSQQQLLTLLNAPKTEPFVILDVRSQQEFNQGHIKGALNISHDQIEQHLTELSQYKDTLVVVHCRSGRRAQVAEAVLIEQGFNKLHHLSGDYQAWVAADLPLVK
ncbi:hypothetical protein tinsulaeT_13150 [Thalassotalea insulae]|uniref:Rhodanese domain-containing protein n=1 Tax=Thalassotalea insulae TaxID=2056778 RepID=A0ABQ6GTG3_9GAMM|nr:rhodanese-like domain-containing protein [Thalassotalea insulae]GLX77975.1 hypothetical protein tinsulaeT_13150 [Thalassotalea insulae]